MEVCNNPLCDNEFEQKRRGKRRKYCCKQCKDLVGNNHNKPYKTLIKKEFCISCGPKVEYHYCQLTIDHVDGDKNNNQLDNLRILCCNCHALKTFTNKDYLRKDYRASSKT